MDAPHLALECVQQTGKSIFAQDVLLKCDGKVDRCARLESGGCG